MADERVPGRAGIGEHDRDLAVLDLIRGPAVLRGDPDGLVTLLDHLGVVDDQDSARVAEVFHHVIADLRLEGVRAPRAPAQKRLHPARMAMPGPLREGPAVLLLQVRQQPVDQVSEHLPRLRPGEQMPHPAGQLPQP